MGNHKKGKNYNWCNDREYAFWTYSLYCQVTRVFQLTLARKLSIFLWWLQQGFWRPNWSIIQNLTLKMTYSFGMVSVWLKKYFLIIAVLVKTTLMHCPLQKLELVDPEESWLPCWLMLISTIQQSDNLNTQNTVLTNNSVLVTSS